MSSGSTSLQKALLSAVKDGREIVATGCAGTSYGIGEGNKTITEFTFDTVIDINEVDYVTVMREKLEIAE